MALNPPDDLNFTDKEGEERKPPFQREHHLLDHWSQMERVTLEVNPETFWQTIPYREAQGASGIPGEPYETVLPPPPPPEQEERPPITEEPPPPPTYPDQKAQAEALKEAAKSGAPFCEECEKAKKDASPQ